MKPVCVSVAMSSTERMRQWRKRRREEKVHKEYTEFLMNTSFSSDTTEAEKMRAFTAMKNEEKAKKKKMAKSDTNRRYRLKRKLKMEVQKLQDKQELLSDESSAPTQNQNGVRQKSIIQFDGDATTYIISADGCIEGVQSNAEPKTYVAPGSSKRFSDIAQDQGKLHKQKPAKKLKTHKEMATGDNYGDDEDPPENCLQESFEMIEIEEPMLKQEIFESEEFDGFKCEDPSVQSTQKNPIETVYCTPEIFKMEPSDVEEFSPPTMKVESLDVLQDNKEEESILQDKPMQMWCCQMRFDSQLQFNLHVKRNHAVKGLPLASGSRKMLQTVTPAPLDAIPGVSGLLFLPSVATTTLSTPGLSVPSSCCGPVTVTTTFSYSSLTTSMSGSSITPSKLISPSPIFVHLPLTSSPVLPHSITTASESSSSIDTPSQSISLSSSNPTPSIASHGQKIIVAQKSNPSESSTASKRSLLLTAQPSSEKKLTQPPKSQAIQIFRPRVLKIDHLHKCATDDSETFSISLAEFSKDKRVSIKQKMVEVIGCIKENNVSPENILIAYQRKLCKPRKHTHSLSKKMIVQL